MTQDWRHGEKVKIDGNVGDEQGSVRGLRGRVVGNNCVHDDGKRRIVNVETETGEMVGVPEKALRKVNR